MKIRLPNYSGKDYLVFSFFVLPLTIVINAVVFGTRVFSGLSFFLLATLVTGIGFTLDFIICGSIAVLLKKRFPAADQSWQRLSILILLFLVITGLFLLALFRGYEAIDYFGYHFNESAFVWTYFVLGIASIFLTFLYEGFARFESWKVNQKETEELRKIYRQSRLLSLKNQVNPHFLFNSLNSLSSLIQVDEKKGERFLDEMSKVYRYMLHHDEDQLVTLENELKFLESYLFLLETRHTCGLNVKLLVPGKEGDKWLPPMTLQTIIDNIVSQNAICKDIPLEIIIDATEADRLVIRNNVLPKMAPETDAGPGIDNLVQKYALLNQSKVLIRNTASENTVSIPLITNKTEALS